jgi:acyl-CoA synthetase (AMP-forming)/AMP-acid ligase II
MVFSVSEVRLPDHGYATDNTSQLRAIIDFAATKGGVFLESGRDDRTVTYQELAEVAELWALEFDAMTLPIGAPVLLVIDDPLTCAAVFLAVIAAGRCAVPADPDAPQGDLDRTVAVMEPLLVVTDLTNVRLGGSLPQVIVTRDRMHPLNRPPVSTGHRKVAAGSVRLGTSGSTGEPKIVELSEAQLIHVARSVVSHNMLTSRDRGYCSLPLFHINAEVVGLLSTLVAGATLVVDRRFPRKEFWDLLHERRISWVNGVPAIWAILARESIPAPPASLRFVRSASAPLRAELRETISTALGVPVVESYGMTEAASQITATPLHGPARPGSAGIEAGAQVRIRDQHGNDVPPDELGRVWIRGPGVITGYVGGRDAHRFDEHGWLDTGDVGSIGRDGYIVLTGRADDVINRGGELVHPREVEEVLLGDGRVNDVAVVGRPDEILGFVPVAQVVPWNTDLSPLEQEALIADLTARCLDHLSRFKRPAEISVVADLPRAPTGKVRKHQVRQRVLVASKQGART